MQNTIYYFTGTGNSFSIAKIAADKLEETQVLSIANLIKQPDIHANTPGVGFIFPCYYGVMPQIVVEFVKKLDLSKADYIFTIMTRGGGPSRAFIELEEILTSKGKKLSSAFKINMPGNYIREYNPLPPWITKKILAKGYKKLDKILHNIKDRQSIIEKDNSSKLIEKYSNLFLKKFRNNLNTVLVKEFMADEKCNSCGTCNKICPKDNISIINGKPSWGNNCEDCLACINYCPKQAIQIGEKTKARRRISNPNVSVNDLIQQKQ